MRRERGRRFFSRYYPVLDRVGALCLCTSPTRHSASIATHGPPSSNRGSQATFPRPLTPLSAHKLRLSPSTPARLHSLGLRTSHMKSEHEGQ